MPGCGEPDDLEDIEDMTDDPVVRLEHREVALKRFPKKDGEEETDENKELLPGKGSIYIKTWGCSHNNSDGEYMAGLLASQGYEITPNRAKADLWLLNSCTVKNPSQDVFVNAIKAGTDSGAKIVVAGCVPQGQPDSKDLAGFSIVGVQQIDRVVEVVEETLKGHQVRLLGTDRKTAGAPLDLPKIRKNPFIEIIPINSGCLNQCTYCKTKHARGDLRSYPIDEIVNRAVQVFKEGVVEIWLTSEDTGTYGRDIGVSLPDLLWQLTKVIPPGCMLRVGMTNPPYILEHLEQMAEIFKHPRVFSFLHVPVQACADSVLLQMKRKYTCEDFLQVVNFLRERVPDMTLATDVICGFPTETADHFEETLRVFEEYRFPIVNISQFYPRPGTPAAKMPRVPTSEVKRRSTAMTRLFESYQTFDNFVGKVLPVLITEMATDGVHMVGHTKSYVQVLLPNVPELMGRMVTVHILSATKFSLQGEVVQADTPIEVSLNDIRKRTANTTTPTSAPSTPNSANAATAVSSKDADKKQKRDRNCVSPLPVLLFFAAVIVLILGLTLWGQ